MNLATLKKQAQAGFTLVELLVVILIIVILSVTMLPLLKPFVTKAQYAAEGVPVIGNLRTKVELYRIEKDHMPGIPLDTQGKPVTNFTIGSTGFSVTADKDAQFGVMGLQSMEGVNEANATNTGSVAWFESGSPVLTVAAGNALVGETLHVFNKIDVNYADLTGKRLRPYHFQYMVPYSKGEDFCWIIGVFGDGGTLPLGTGYAVLEFNFTLAKAKFVATFERYKPESNDHLMLGSANYPSLNGNLVIPNLTAILAATDQDTAQSAVEAFKVALRVAKWDVQ